MEKPYEQMDDLGGKTTPIFWLTSIYTSKLGFLACEAWRSSSDSETTILNKDPWLDIFGRCTDNDSNVINLHLTSYYK